MDRRSERDRDRDRHRDRRRHDERRNRSNSRSRRDRSRSRRKTPPSRHDVERKSPSRHDRERKSPSRHRERKSPSRQRDRKSSSRHRERKSPPRDGKSSSRHNRDRPRSHKEKRTPPPPSISIVESVPYSATSRKDAHPEHFKKQKSPDISQLEKHNKKPGAYCNLKLDEPIDKEKIHKEIEEKLRETLAREGIEYNAPKPEATHPVFANDGSFLEIFKKMQEAQHETQPEPLLLQQQPSTSYAPPPMLPTSNTVPRPQIPIFGRRRGGKILKTGVVAKPKSSDNDSSTDPKDFWSIYLREVNKYKNAACDSDAQSRPLVK
ncbi:C19orf43 family protein [Megaselia abdita]